MSYKAKPLLERFNKKVIRQDGCWAWNGSKDRHGYGRIGAHTPTGYRPVPASRASFELFIGPIPDGLNVCHRCDNPPCTNPDHLFLGTDKENAVDMVSKGRCRAGWQNAIKTHCKNGHEFTPENTGPRKDAIRNCRKCSVIRTIRYRDKNKVQEVAS